MLAAFVLWSHKRRDPIVDLSIFTVRPMLMIAVVGGLAFGAFTLVSSMLPMLSMAEPGDGFGLGMSATGYSAVATPMFLCVTVGGFFVGKTVARIGGRRCMALDCSLTRLPADCI